MEKKIILSGTPKAIANIVQENRVREKRGDVHFQEYDEQYFLEREREEREDNLSKQEELSVAREVELGNKEGELNAIMLCLSEREESLRQFERAITEREATVFGREKDIAKRERAIAKKETQA